MMPLAITGMGARTPVGPGAHETFFSVQAKFNGFRESFVIDHTGEHVVVSAIPPFLPQVGEEARLLELGTAALVEALQSAAKSWPQRRRLGLVLVTPEPAERPAHWSFPSTVLQSLVALLPEPRQGPSPLLVPGGHTGWAQALEHVSRLLSQGQVDACVLGAVDTLCTPRTLEHLDRQRLLRNDQEEDGMIPGEAAAFLVLEPLRARPPVSPLACVAAWADSAALADEKPPLPGAVLTRATRECLRRGGERDATPGLIVSDMGGAKHEALEVAFARFRAFRDQASSALLLHPAECLGDVGAATGPLLMVLATLCHVHGMAPRGDALLTTNTRTGRSAVALIRPERS
jgi:3-oxoacyl-[acyl-carrier-protein] synthase-1